MMAHGCGTSPDQNAQRQQQQQQQQQQHQQCSEEEQDARGGGGGGGGGDSALPSRRGSADSGMDGGSANGEASVSAADDASDGAAISGSTAASATTGTSDEEQGRRKRRRVRSADAAIAAPSENCEGGTGASTASAGARTAESIPTPAGSSGFRPQSPHLPGPGGGLSLGMRVATHTAHGQWAGGWRTLARKKAVLRGLDKIFSMAQSEDNFTLFGNDIIQCFYDVASATGEPVRARALMYVEQLAQRWKTTVRHAGWRQGDTATAPEIIDAIVAMYCLERVGIHDDVKVEVEAALDAYTAKDYLGWNPLAGPPPERVLDVYTGAPITPWRAMSNSLISTFYAHRVGVRLGCGYEDVFRWLRALRPYRGPRELKWQEYMDQCYLVAHVILTLNSWGELRLEPELLPHEYLFVREHLAVQITQRDVHLVGQFIEVLRVFGAADSDPLIQAGITFLLQAQEEDGSWDRGEDRDDYTTYHATMVGIQALLVHVYRGSGPGITSLAPLLEEWYAEEMCRESKPLSSTAAVDEANDTSPTSSDSESRSPRKRALCKEQKAIKAVRSMAQDIGRRAKMQDWQGVEALLLELEGRSDVGCSVLQATSIGKTVKKLRAVSDLGVAEAARRLVERWRELVSAMLSHPP